MAKQSPSEQMAATENSRNKGPAVWLDMDQKELDDSYDQSVYAPNQQLVAHRRRRASEATLERIAPQRAPYGPSEVEQLDIYRTPRWNAPILIFIHGGAWRNGTAKDFAFPAEMFIAAGAHFVVPDFVQVQDAGGSLLPMAEQVRRAVAWVYGNAPSFGGDPDRVFLSGHSSGAHLSGVTLVTDWARDFVGIPPDIIKGGLLVSGMYDLKPVRLSKRSEYVRFTDEIEEKLSAQRHLDKLDAPIVVAYGNQETPEFQRQSRDFAAAVKAAGKPVQLIVGEGYNHFEMQETFGHPYRLAGRAALALMKLQLGGV